MNFVRTIGAYTFAALVFLIPLVGLHAQVGTDRGASDVETDAGGRSDSGSRIGVSNETISFENPLGDTTLLGLFNTILDVLLIFAVPIIVFFIIYAGFQYVFARGDTNAIQNANRALLYSVIGGVLILGAKVLLDVISNTIAAIGG